MEGKMFDDKYQVFLADTEESKKIHYQLRYQVYCLDKGFEAAEDFPDEMEIDEYDHNAVHFIVKDKRNGQWLAAMRLVISSPDQLPLRKVVAINDAETIDQIPKVAELSRLSVLEDFRYTPCPKDENSIRPTGPELILGLLRAGKLYCQCNGIEHWLFLCRNSLAHILKRSGLNVHKIGPKCNYRGPRFPFRMNILNAFDDVHEAHEDMFNDLLYHQSYISYAEHLQAA